MKVALGVSQDRLMIKHAGESLFFEDFMTRFEAQEVEKSEAKTRASMKKTVSMGNIPTTQPVTKPKPVPKPVAKTNPMKPRIAPALTPR
jgi:hypothetical protein